MLVASCTLVPCRLVLHHMVFFFFLTKIYCFFKQKIPGDFFLENCVFSSVHLTIFSNFFEKNAKFSISKFIKKAPIVTPFKLGALN